MITVQRRWFVPADKLEEFQIRWDREIMPAVIQQPGFIRAELYESDIRGHWLTSISWEDEASTLNALKHLRDLYKEFEPYERFGVERLKLLSSSK
jgi:heme-degrading monooxygenase HmoA